MGYSKYKKLKTVIKKFNLDARSVRLFENISPVQPSNWLTETLEISHSFPMMNEKMKAERVISPILVDVARQYMDNITLFSGEELEVQPENDLSGECDFFFALHPPKPYLDTPIISLTEAKDEDLEWGIAQCAAQMYGAKLYNEAENHAIPVIYGCATDGIEWHFLKLENDIFYVDVTPMTDLPQILGTWHYIVQFYINSFG
jgi:hypothetical protein